MLTGRQIREARKLAKWSREKLATKASLSIGVVDAIESGDGPAWLTEAQEASLREAFIAAGVDFGPDGPRLASSAS